MTVGTAGNRFTYAGDGTTVAFSFPRLFAAGGDLRVILRVDATGEETVQTIVTDYDVSGAGEPTGGTVTMTSAPEAGETLVIVRRTEQRQETDYVTGGGFSAKSHEDALDKLTLMVQDLEEKVNRALKLAETTPTAAAPTLPEGEARKHLRWDGAATDLENVDVVSLGALGFTATADNRLMKSDGTAGIQESGITVDDGDNVSGVGTFSAGGLFSDDNVLVGAASSGTFTFRRDTDGEVLGVSGGNTGNAGANIQLYGGAHGTLANDIILRSGTTNRLHWDDSLGRWVMSGNTLVLGDEASSSIGIISPDNDGAFVVSGGNGQEIGANVRLFGSTHSTQASDIDLRTGVTVRARWDQSSNRWDFFGNAIYGISAVLRNAANGILFLGADTASTAGANIILYGSAHAGQPNHIDFRQGATLKLRYDHSAGAWDFQNLPVTGVNQLLLQGTRHVHSNTDDQFCVFSGGDAGAVGANIIMYGQNHATIPSNLILRTDGISRLRWDNASSRWDFHANQVIGLGDMTMSVGPKITAGLGSPEGVVSAAVGSIFLRSDGGSSTSLYVKESGSSNVGWVPK